MSNNSTSLKTIVDFARRKGLVYPSSEIYGGFAATYDFGPLGKLLKDNLVNAWRDWMVNYRTDTVEIEGAIFLHPKVWEASGHISGFSDLLVEDIVTKKRFRADHLVEEAGVKFGPKYAKSYYAEQQKSLEKSSGNNTFKETSDLIYANKNIIYLVQNSSEEILIMKNGDLPAVKNQQLHKLFPNQNSASGVRLPAIDPSHKIVHKIEDDEGENVYIIYAEFEGNKDDFSWITKSELKGKIIQSLDNVFNIDVSFFKEIELPLPLENVLITDAGSFTSNQIDEIIDYYQLKSPDGNPLSKAKKFNLLVKTHLGPIEDDSSLAYLKGESCANTYVDWKQVQETTRRKLPFGIAQLGKAFRNEITVKQYMFRTREFEQIDMEFFVKPPDFVKKDGNGENLEKDHFEWFKYWKEERMRFYTEFLGYNPTNLKWHQHSPEELVFYAAEAWDIYYNFGQLGYKEMEGVHNRTDYDTRQHQKFSGTDLTYLDPETNERYLPYIVEMSLGVNRLFLSTLFEFYTEEKIENPQNTALEEQIRELEQVLANLKNDQV